MADKSDRCTETVAARSGLGSDTAHGAVVPPLHLSSTFTFDGFNNKRDYDYTRSGNPTRDTLAQVLAELEGGANATITSSGMAAITLVCQLLEKDDLLIAPHDCYGGTHRLLSALQRRGQFRVLFADLTDTANLSLLFAQRPKMVLVETPSNPLLRITDVAAVAQLCRRHEALLVADNTFLSPAWQRPIELGADVVLHSTTKYLNGHSDVVGGAVIARDAALAEEIAWWGNCIGVTGAPFDSFLTLRGLRTLCVRARAHEENALRIAGFLAEDPRVREVYYPGLPDHPGHQLARTQQRGFGAMISLELDGGDNAVRAFLDGLEHFFLAESLGGVESLVAHPATMTHAAMSPEEQATAGITQSLVRLSIGIESADDLVADLAAGLDRAAPFIKPGRIAVSATHSAGMDIRG
ncbi:MAG: cystathionine gamma-synthase [Gammaproteobacteria bacterium]|nr:cystathionine gamma-synthase [Gammaproteobacteria bacterium]NNM21206.1 cystathionine gamma-synthase [Gammaproteobacteria bacterium]